MGSLAGAICFVKALIKVHRTSNLLVVEQHQRRQVFASV